LIVVVVVVVVGGLFSTSDVTDGRLRRRLVGVVVRLGAFVLRPPILEPDFYLRVCKRIHRVTVTYFLHIISTPAVLPPFCGASSAKRLLFWHHYRSKIAMIRTFS